MRKGVGLAVAVAALILLSTFSRDSGSHDVFIAGAGALAEVLPADAPKGAKYHLRTKRRESIDQTAARVEKVLGFWPRIVVAFDTTGVVTIDAILDAQASVLDLAAKAEASGSRVYMIGFVPGPDATPAAVATAARLNAWWLDEVCGAPHIRCVEPPPYSDEPTAARRAMREAIERALAGHHVVPTEPEVEPNT